MEKKEKSHIILETERLILRYQESADIVPLVKLWTDPEVTKHMGGPRESDWLKTEFEKTAQDPYVEQYDLWPVIEKVTGQTIGHCGLLDKEVEDRMEIELVYILASAFWGKGYATEIAQGLKQHAFEKLGIDRLISLIEPENAASERVAIKAGMTMEKTIIRPGNNVRKLYVIEK